jgi:hypothetical protein
LLVIALPEPHTLAAAQVDGREDEHAGSPENAPPLSTGEKESLAKRDVFVKCVGKALHPRAPAERAKRRHQDMGGPFS